MPFEIGKIGRAIFLKGHISGNRKEFADPPLEGSLIRWVENGRERTAGIHLHPIGAWVEMEFGKVEGKICGGLGQLLARPSF